MMISKMDLVERLAQENFSVDAESAFSSARSIEVQSEIPMRGWKLVKDLGQELDEKFALLRSLAEPQEKGIDIALHGVFKKRPRATRIGT